MVELTLTEEEKIGAKRISDGLAKLIEEEGTDRPIFATVTRFIISDIEDAL